MGPKRFSLTFLFNIVRIKIDLNVLISHMKSHEDIYIYKGVVICIVLYPGHSHVFLQYTVTNMCMHAIMHLSRLWYIYIIVHNILYQ